MARLKTDRKPNWFDPSQEAKDHLNTTLDSAELPEDVVIVNEKLKALSLKEKFPLPERPTSAEMMSDEINAHLNTEPIDIKTARNEVSVLTHATNRQKARILFFTKDESVLLEGSETFKRITDLRHTFAEVHVVLLNSLPPNEASPILRLFDTVWLYATQSTSSWKMSMDAYKLAEQQLVFSGGFRADIIIAEDTFEAGLAGWFIAKKHERPIQLHVYDDFFDAEYVATLEHPTLYTWATHYVINHVSSIRTRTEPQRLAAIAINKKLRDDAELFPSYYNLTAWRDFMPTFSLYERYPQFKFIILHISLMHTSSHTYEVLLATSALLRRYPTVGLVIVGNGPLRTQLEKQAIALGLQNQIEFEPMPAEVLSHLKSANVLIHISDDATEDDVILSAASVKIPLVANKNSIAGKLFVDRETARLCDPSDIACVTESINMYLSDNRARTAFALGAQDAVFERIEQDYAGYLEAYASSIERSLAQGG